MVSVITMARMDTSTTGKHIPALDGVRGCAILLVLANHLFGFNSSHPGSALWRVIARTLDAGWIGVDLFFVLSGFLITGILYDTLDSPSYFCNFFARRFLRIAPLYYGFLFGGFALCIVLGDRVLWSNAALCIAYLQSLVRGVHQYTTSRWFNLLPLWSLGVEENFYLVWPFLVVAARTKRRIVLTAMLFATASIGVRIWLVLSGRAAVDIYYPYNWTPARVDTLLFGAVLAMLIRSRFRQRTMLSGPWVFAAGFGLTVTYSVYAAGLRMAGDPCVSTVGYSALGVTACGVIASVVRDGSAAQRVFSSRTLRFFGKYSYGLYLIHFSVLRALEPVTRPYLLAATHSNVVSIVVTAFLAAAASIALAWLLYRCIEAPCLRLKRYFQDGSPRPKLRSALMT